MPALAFADEKLQGDVTICGTEDYSLNVSVVLALLCVCTFVMKDSSPKLTSRHLLLNSSKITDIHECPTTRLTSLTFTLCCVLSPQARIDSHNKVLIARPHRPEVHHLPARLADGGGLPAGHQSHAAEGLTLAE